MHHVLASTVGEIGALGNTTSFAIVSPIPQVGNSHKRKLTILIMDYYSSISNAKHQNNEKGRKNICKQDGYFVAVLHTL